MGARKLRRQRFCERINLGMPGRLGGKPPRSSSSQNQNRQHYAPILQWLCASPIEIPNLTSYILKFLTRDFQSGHTHPIDKAPAPPPEEPISHLSSVESLPSELLSHIATFLPAPAIFRIRRCSKPLLFRIPSPKPFGATKSPQAI